MKILVTGASGHLGSKIVENLVKRVPTSEIIAGVRDTQSVRAKAFATQGIEIRETDFDKKETLVEAFQAVDRVFIVSTRVDVEATIHQQTYAVEAAKEAGVTQMVYSSAPRADVSEFFLAEVHRIREDIIKESGIPYVFVRNNWYVENELGTIQQCLNGAPWVTSAGEGKVGWVYRPDLAEVTANILAGEGHENKAYELAGENLTQQQFVDAVNEVTGKEIEVMNVDDASFGKMLKEANLPEEVVAISVMVQQCIREGGLESAHSDLEMLLGRNPTSVKEALQQLLS
ncbi:SDR family oxidoreductase [Peribacillus simplex]|uniref:SDR family oxidoreductase n=2 Tax=Peribacillus TaxID=2675229 RepID=A0AA90PG25_9BACI|nr:MULTISPECIES: SDR family oxidoreductase [Peribacillus]MDP1418892.1 SDR family oxidoreductase [Peribacillus simplex]MDP1451585.1 SDR family oxidoreductase [Peribacillus frigoritolerans]